MALKRTLLALAVVASAPMAVHADGLAGAYLAGRSAAFAGDHREAAAYFDQALRVDPNNAFLIGNAMFANAAIGDWSLASEIATLLPPDVSGQELANLVVFVTEVASGDLADATALIEAGQGPGPLTNAMIRAWLTFGQGDMSGAASLHIDPEQRRHFCHRDHIQHHHVLDLFEVVIDDISIHGKSCIVDQDINVDALVFAPLMNEMCGVRP